MAHHGDGCELKDEDSSSAFTDSCSSGNDREQDHGCTLQQQLGQDAQGGSNSNSGSNGNARHLYRGALRIELPHSGSPPCTSPASPAEGTATATHRSSPRTAIYRTGENDAFLQRESEACTPTTVMEQSARQSALALLHADISAKMNLSQSAGRDSSRLSHSLSPAVSGSFEMAEVPKKKAPLQQFFANRSRKQRSTLSTSSNAFNTNSVFHAREISNALDLTSGADQDTHHHSHVVTSSTSPRHDSGTGDGAHLQQLSSSRLAASLSSMERLPSGATSNAAATAAAAAAAPPTAVSPAQMLASNGGGSSNTTGEEGDGVEDSCTSSAQHIGMEAVLRDASRVRGIRLTWLLYLLVVMVIVLFTLLLVQIIYESNRTLVRTATQAVRAQASVLVNSIDIEQYSLTNIFVMLHDLDIQYFNRSTHSYAIVREMFCSRFYGAPMAFALYNRTGDRVWAMRCSLYPLSKGFRRLPDQLLPGVEAVRVAEYAVDATMSMRTFVSEEDGSVETFAILLDKNTLGRTLFGNNFPQYSSATLQYVTSGFVTRYWNNSEPTMMFHTLTKATPNYTSTESGPVRDGLVSLFNNVCFEGSPYVWHTVSHYADPSEYSSDSEDDQPRANLRWPVMTTNEIPPPHLVYGRSWGQLSVANFCGVQCFGSAGDNTCDFDNPTNIWFVVEYSLIKQNGLSSILNVVGIISIVALILFSFVMFLVYISITVPVNFLRVQLLKAVGATDTQSNFQRKMVQWTYRLWLGDLTAIVRSTHILSLCFQLNKRYVPDHVLRNHAQQLFLRRRKVNFLDEVDLKDDPSDREDSESESDLVPALVQLPSVSPVMPSSDSRFLWRIAGSNDQDGTVRQSSELEVPPTCNEPTAPSAAAGVRSFAGDVPPLAPPRATSSYDPSAAVYVTRSKSMKRATTYLNDMGGPWPVGEVDGSACDVDFSLAASALPNTRNLSTMTIRRDSESTILCVHIPSVELAYLMNYAAAVVQHRRMMRILLSRIRRHKGALFHRSGDSLAAVWNAFEGCPNHAETAAACAQEIANAFAPLRAEGLHIGVVLHQGVLVCGSVEYSKAAFVTAFGDGPREALVLADLAATVGSLNVLVSESVKQSLSGLYDCNIVDVVQLQTSAHPLLLFELGGRRQTFLSAAPVLRAQFAVEYARAFAQFRNHEFSEALQGIEHIRLNVGSAQNEHLLRRLERLCFFYASSPAALPLPYSRAFPAWVNYEAVAQAGLQSNTKYCQQRSNSHLSRSFLDGVVYAGVPAAQNDVEYIKDFKQELQENMRRTARKGNGSPTIDDSSTRPHVTPQPSPPMRPTADPTTMMMSEPVMSVGSGMETMADDNHNNQNYMNSGTFHHNNCNDSTTNGLCNSFTASVKPRHIDAMDWNDGASPELSVHEAAAAAENAPQPPPLMAPVTAVPALTAAGSLPLLTFPVAHMMDHITEHASLVGSSIQTMDSPRDVFALSNRFAMTQRVTNRPPVALAAGSPELPDLTAERVGVQNGGGGGGTLTRPSSFHSSGQNDNNTTSNSIIQSAGMSFKCSVNGAMQGLSARMGELPSEITAKSGTTYLRSTRILGKGSFGCVYLGMDAHSGRLVAIKFLPMPSDESGMEEIEAEVLILQRVNDTHVVQLLSYAFEGDTIVIIMECMLAGSLQNMISAFGSIPSSTSRVFMRDVLRGLSKIHSMGVIHRDMKPQNVLLSLAGNCKISDFGASAWLQELARKESRGQVCGTPVYLAPEAARGNPAKESDVWSCGIMFLQMITGALPYPPAQLSAGAAVLVFQIGSGIAQPQIPEDLDELDAEFVRACLEVEPSKRLTVSALLQLPIFTV